MARAKGGGEPPPQPKRKPVAWLHGEIKTPPFSAEARQEAGDLLRSLQEGEKLGMPQAELLPIVGKRCGALRVRDEQTNWRIMYRIDPDAILITEVYAKKTQQIPDEVIKVCQRRLSEYDRVKALAAKQAAKDGGTKQK